MKKTIRGLVLSMVLALPLLMPQPASAARNTTCDRALDFMSSVERTNSNAWAWDTVAVYWLNHCDG